MKLIFMDNLKKNYKNWWKPVNWVSVGNCGSAFDYWNHWPIYSHKGTFRDGRKATMETSQVNGVKNVDARHAIS